MRGKRRRKVIPMPLTINVGLSRKTSENYNSAGTSINLTAELDQSLLARPRELQGAIDELYEQAELALEQQARSDRRDRDSEPRRNGSPNGSQRNDHDRRQNAGGNMTNSQAKAIHAIAKRLDLDPAQEAHHEFGIDLDRMSVREASQFIDHLKSLQASGNQKPHPNGVRR